MINEPKMKRIQIGSIIYRYDTKNGFQMLSVGIEPITPVDLKGKIREIFPYIRDEYSSIRETLEKDLGYSVKQDSLIQHINNNSIKEEIKLEKENLIGNENNPYDDGMSRFNLGYEISDNPRISLDLYSIEISQEEMARVYSSIFKSFNPSFSDRAETAKNQIQTIMENGRRQVDLERLLAQ